MPVTPELLQKINDYEKQGYTSDEIVKGLSQSKNFPDIAQKAQDYLSKGYSTDEVLNGMKSSPISSGSNIGKTQNVLSSLKKEAIQGAEALSKPLPGAAPLVGAVAGSLVAGPVGGAVGYYGGKQAERVLQTGQVGTPNQQVGDINEAMLQEIIAGIPNAVKPYVAKVANKFLGKKLTPEMTSNIKLGQDTEVPLSPANITGSKPAGLIESHLDKNVATAGESQAFKQTQFDALDKLKQKLQESFGGRTGTLEAGQLAQESGNTNKAAWMSKAQKLYDAVPIDPTTPIETANLRDTAIGHLDELGKMSNPGIKRILKIAEQSGEIRGNYSPGANEITSNVSKGSMTDTTLNIGRGRQITLPATAEVTHTPSEGLVDATGKLFSTNKNNMPTYTWQELTADRADLNKIIRTTSDPNKKRVLYDVVNAIDDDISAFSESMAPGVKEAFSKATKFYKEGAQIFRDRQIANTLKSTNPEDIVKTFIKSNNPSEIGRLSQAVGPEGMAPIKQAWLEQLVTKGGGEAQSFSPAKFSTAFEKYDDATLKSFLTQKEIDGLKTLSRIGKLTGSVEKIAGNPSGTGQTNITTGTIYALMRHPVLMTTSMIGSNKFAKEYFTNPEFRNVFINGIKMKSTSSEATKMAARLAGMAKINNNNFQPQGGANE